MSAEVDSVLTRLAVLEREIINPVNGKVVKAYDNVPYTISVADMPLFVNYARTLTQNNPAGNDYDAREFYEIRNYDLVFYHSPYMSGVEGEKAGLLTPYFPLVYAKFGSYPHLKNLGGVVEAKLTADSGMTIVTFVGQNYFGIRFTLQVTGKVRRTLADNE